LASNLSLSCTSTKLEAEPYVARPSSTLKLSVQLPTFDKTDKRENGSFADIKRMLQNVISSGLLKYFTTIFLSFTVLDAAISCKDL